MAGAGDEYESDLDSDYEPSSDESEQSSSSSDENDDSSEDDIPLAQMHNVWERCTTNNTGLLAAQPFVGGQKGLKVACGDSPMDYFTLFCTPNILEMIVVETNRYAHQKITGKVISRRSRMKRWKDTTTEEMKVFLALSMHMGHVQLPSIRQYWSRNVLLKQEIFSYNMSLNRFEILLANLHLANSELDPGNNRLYKLEPVLKHTNEVMAESYNPGKELSLDECMVLWRGRLVFRQYIANKRHKYGVKFYCLCTSNGLTLRMLVYTGEIAPHPIYGHTGSVVLRLMAGLLDQGYSLYMDNYYNSFGLAHRLLERGTYCTGTLNPRRKDNPKDVMNTTLKKGDVLCKSKQGVIVGKWVDKRVVTFITTEHAPTMIEINNRRGIQKRKPLAIAKYNAYMSGVDRSDQMSSYYNCARKCRKWWRKMFFHFIEVWLYNAFYMRKETTGSNDSFLTFRMTLIREWLNIPDEGRVPHRHHAEDGPLPPHHVMEIIPPTPRKRYPSLRCVKCSGEGIRKETRYRCVTCPGNPSLCKAPCFQSWAH